MARGPSNGRLRHMVGTLVYMAPEVLRGSPHDTPADVYAFGITINEIAAACVPYVDRCLPVPELHTVLETRFNEVKLRAAITTEHLRPVHASDCPSVFAELVSACWHPDPAQRPDFPSIVSSLQRMQDAGAEFNEKFHAAASRSHDALVGDVANLQVKGQTLEEQILEAASGSGNPVWMNAISSDYRPSVYGGVSATSGKRGEDRMEDRHIIAERLTGLPDHHLYGVFDGHGGQTCAQFVSDLLPAAIVRWWCQPEASPDSCLCRAFEDTDSAYGETHGTGPDSSGSTGIVAFVVKDLIYVANIGDSRCVLASSTGVRDLSAPHLPSNPMERAMVEARGGYIHNDRVNGLLMITRAFGDFSAKPAICATPEIISTRLGPQDEFIILASDGLWDVVSSEEAVRLVRSTVRVPEMAAKRLALKALELGSSDNITVIVAFLVPVESCMHS
uniref:PPM-type phosphatase domain-containing protein n=1 Tax=Compsopogon caeruleus TaxID=31354 RepID=A0A7S1XG84_9RHOD